MIHGFELLRDEEIAELRTRARLYRHAKTGAELLSLSNDDENKVFGIVFRTPPTDSTGVAHILEHSVLCGSRKYPAKEPFVELLKGSLKTFLNAFTYPDKTCYPVASQNTQDFYNLVDVYLDAVFYPRLTPFVLQQEGWHYELENSEGPLTYKGVVFNEMKGAYSSPENVLAETSQQSIFPDITYGLDSGGNPRQIPSLTFEQFKSFHERHYHPSNARIYFYGDDDPEERLRIVDAYLNEFGSADVDSKVPLQPAFNEPRRIVRPFSSSGDGEGGQDGKGMVTINWLLPETSDLELNYALEVINFALLGMPGSPLRKALIDSGLGAGLAGSGLESELRQMYFSTGLKGIEPAAADMLESLILDTLSSIVRKGFDPETVEAAVNTIEFRLRENNSGSYPRGLALMLQSLSTWLYGGDPLAIIAFEGPLASLKERLSAEPKYLESLIDRHFLRSSHRSTVVLKPDPLWGEKEKSEEDEELEAVRKRMSQDELQQVIANALTLRELQETPDPPEALATIPRLKISDLDRMNKVLPSSLLMEGETKILYHDIFTNGVAYVDLGFNLHTLPHTHLPYVPLFGRVLTEMGTRREDFVSLTRRISRKTGGIRPEFFTSCVLDGNRTTAWLFLRGKAMIPKGDDLMDIFRDILLDVKLDNRERFRQMVLEEKARKEQKLVPNGHQFVNLRLRSHFNESDWAAEQMSGVSYLVFLRKLAREVDENWPGVLEVLEEMRRRLVDRRSMIVNATMDEAGWQQFSTSAREFIHTLPTGQATALGWRPDPDEPNEGLIIPSQVNFVGKGADLYRYGYKFHGSLQVISGYLRNSWLWDKIRVQGGAYGAFCLFDRPSGVFTFVSYRDPNLLKTLESFDAAAQFLRDASLPQDELSKSIIGAIGRIDSYLLPDARGYISMLRHLSGDTDEVRQQMRDEVLSTTAEDFRAFAEVLDRLKEEAIVKVLGSQRDIETAVSGRPGWLKTFQVL